MIYGDGEDDLLGFTFSPFTIRTESDDEAPVTKGKLKAIHEKLDSLLQASKPSSSDDYSQALIKPILETITKEHSSNLETKSLMNPPLFATKRPKKSIK